MNLSRALVLGLVVQIALALFTWWPTDRSDTRARPLLDLERDAIDAIVIQRAAPDMGDAPAALSLERVDGAWRIASSHGYRADDVKVTALLDKLLGLTIRAPIANTAASHNALSVGAREYGRRITVRAGDVEREIIVGAAATNRVNVRLAKDDTVYVAQGASEWSFSDRPESYRPANYVDVAPGAISTFAIRNQHGHFELVREAEGWRLADADDPRALDPEAIETLVSDLVRLPMGAVVAAGAGPEHGFGSGASVMWTETSATQSIGGGYTVGGSIEADRFVLADGQTHVIRLAEASLGALLDARLEDILAAEWDPAAGDPAAPTPLPTDAR